MNEWPAQPVRYAVLFVWLKIKVPIVGVYYRLHRWVFWRVWTPVKVEYLKRRGDDERTIISET